MSVQPLKENVKNVIDWADARNIFHPTDGGTMTSQLFKLVEEVGEAVSGIVKQKKHEAKDGIGDTKVCLINVMEIARRNGMDKVESLSDKEKTLLQLISSIGFMADSILHGDEDKNVSGIADAIDWDLDELAKSEGFTYEECLQQAYDEIKDRKGTMINRCFVKESDLVGYAGNAVDVVEKTQKVQASGVYGKIKTPEERNNELNSFARTIGYDGLFDEAKQAIAVLEGQKTMPLEVIDFVERKFTEYSLLPFDEAKQNFIDENKVLSFDDWFFQNYEDGKEIKEQYEIKMQRIHELSEKQVQYVKGEENAEDLVHNDEFTKIGEEIEAIDKDIKENYADIIIESSTKYTEYKSNKINNSINKTV